LKPDGIVDNRLQIMNQVLKDIIKRKSELEPLKHQRLIQELQLHQTETFIRKTKTVKTITNIEDK
jgi:hypothetical protein